MSNAYKGDNLWDDLVSVVPALIYTLVPTMFGMSGWGALMLGGILPYAAGVFLGIPALRHAAIGILSTHIVMAKGDGLVQQYFGKPLWTLQQNGFVSTANTVNTTAAQQAVATAQSTVATTTQGLNDTQMVEVGTEIMRAHNPQEIEDRANQILDEHNRLDDFIKTKPNLNDGGITNVNSETGQSRVTWRKDKKKRSRSMYGY